MTEREIVERDDASSRERSMLIVRVSQAGERMLRGDESGSNAFDELLFGRSRLAVPKFKHTAHTTHNAITEHMCMSTLSWSGNRSQRLKITHNRRSITDINTWKHIT